MVLLNTVSYYVLQECFYEIVSFMHHYTSLDDISMHNGSRIDAQYVEQDETSRNTQEIIVLKNSFDNMKGN